MDISNYQSITNLFDVPLPRLRDLKDRWDNNRESLSTNDLSELTHYA